MTSPLRARFENRLKGTPSDPGNDEHVLLVSPFAPYRDGISVYAQEELRRLRRDGSRVEVLSPLPSAAHHHLRLGGPKGAAQLASRAARYDRVIVQVAPEFLFGRCRTGAERALVWTALTSMAAQTRLDLRLHEVIYEWLRQGSVERNAARLTIKAADRVTVHTEVEKSDLVAVLGAVANRVEIISHGACFTKRVEVTRAEAKARLGLPPDEFALLCIGFLQQSKGFDRAIEALAMAERSARRDQLIDPMPKIRLHIVGTGRVGSPEIEEYTDKLRSMSAMCPSASLHERFVSDLEFDTWVAASDAVIVPYRQIWSSGVVERARLYDAPLIASDLPQLVDQIPDSGVVCGTVETMAQAIVELVRRRQSATDRLPVATRERDQASELDAGGVTDRSTGCDNSDASGWIVDQLEPDRDLVQKQISIRADLHRVDDADTGVTYRSPGLKSPSVELSSMSGVPRPGASSARPGVSQVKNAVQRLTAWQLDPIARHVDELQSVIVDTVLDLESRLGPQALTGPVDEATRRSIEEQQAISLLESESTAATTGEGDQTNGDNGVDATVEGAR